MLNEEKHLLYSRQLYVVGAETQAKYGEVNVLVVGATGLAAELVKNLTLTGVRSIHLYDDGRKVALSDLSSLFFADEASVGGSSASVVATGARPLNPHVEIDVIVGQPPLEELIPKYSVLVYVDQCTTSPESVRLNEVARRSNVKFVACESRGVVGCIFVDAGPCLDVLDTDGEDTVSCIVTGIALDGLITMHEDRKHECEVGSKVYLTGVASPSCLNSAAAGDDLRLFEVVEVVSPYIVRVRGVAEQVAQSGAPLVLGTRAYLHTTKRQVQMAFKSLRDSIEHPDFCTVFDSAEKEAAAPMLHAIFRAAHEAGGCLSTPEEVEGAVQRASQWGAEVEAELARDLLAGFGGNLNPMACFLGGLAAQEVLKVCSGKFSPLRQWLYYDAREILYARGPVADRDDVTPLPGSRYAGQECIVGKGFQAFLARQPVFIVGAGALGCEHVKNMACIGVQAVTITDMDAIETSNLSRQFLFRNSDIGRPKAEVAAARAMEMNRALRCRAFRLKVGAETEDTFNDDFWEAHAVVVNALDNVESRKYVDSRCLLFGKPLFESGTLGTKCNVQCVIPFVTESYSASYDPPERSIPLCTLKNFPNAIEHTIQWARDAFEMLFANTPREVNQYLESPAAFTASLERDPGSKPLAVKAVMEALGSWPADAAGCVALARLKFNEFFYDSLQQLLHNIPLDKRGENGEAFWSGAKKPPTPVRFDRDDALHVGFVHHTACLLAAAYGLPPLPLTAAQVADIAGATRVPEFVARSATFALSEAEKSDHAAAQLVGHLSAGDLPAVSQFAARRMVPVEFEKDDPKNHHVEFITFCSNLRASAYGIPPADVAKTKQIVGKIIPAMITTTSVATGLVTFEVLKHLLLQYHRAQMREAPSPVAVGLPNGARAYDRLRGYLAAGSPSALLGLYRNAFVNLSLPLIAFSDPIATPAVEYALPNGGSVRWTEWDRIDVNEGRELTVQELVDVVEGRYSLSIFMIALTSGKMIFSSFGRRQDRSKLVTVVAAEKGEEGMAHVDTLTLVVTGTINDEDVNIPVIHYRHRHFDRRTQ